MYRLKNSNESPEGFQQDPTGREEFWARRGPSTGLAVTVQLSSILGSVLAWVLLKTKYMFFVLDHPIDTNSKYYLHLFPQIMTDAAWMLHCSNSENVMMNANRLMGAIDVAIRELWISWTVILFIEFLD